MPDVLWAVLKACRAEQHFRHKEADCAMEREAVGVAGRSADDSLLKLYSFKLVTHMNAFRANVEKYITAKN